MSLVDDGFVVCSIADFDPSASGNADVDGAVYRITRDMVSDEMCSPSTGIGAQANGADIRASTDLAGENQIPCDPVNFEHDDSHGGGEANVLINVKRDHSGSGTTRVVLWRYPGGGQSLPAADSEFGSEAVYDSNHFSYYDMGQDPSGSAPQLIDRTGNGHDMTSNGSMTDTDVSDGPVGSQTDFDGDDYYEKTDPGQFATGNFTVTAWIETTNTSFQIIFEAYSKTSTDEAVQFRMLATGELSFYGRDDDTAFNFAATSTATINDGDPHHVAVVRVGTTAYLYIDGSQDGSDTSAQTDEAMDNSQTDHRIGQTNNTPAQNLPFIGKIGEVVVHSTNRSAAWIALEANLGSDPASYVTVSSPPPFGGLVPMPMPGPRLPIQFPTMQHVFNWDRQHQQARGLVGLWLPAAGFVDASSDRRMRSLLSHGNASLSPGLKSPNSSYDPVEVIDTELGPSLDTTLQMSNPPSLISTSAIGNFIDEASFSFFIRVRIGVSAGDILETQTVSSRTLTLNISSNEFRASLYDGTTSLSIVSGVTATVGEVYHLLVTYRAGTLTLYVNGFNRGSDTDGAYSEGALGVLQISQASNYFQGRIGEVRVYDRELSAAEAWQLYDPATRWALYQPRLATVAMMSLVEDIVLTTFSIQPIGGAQALNTFSTEPVGTSAVREAFSVEPIGGARVRDNFNVQPIGTANVFNTFSTEPVGQSHVLRQFSQQPAGLTRIANDSDARYELYIGEDAYPDLTAAPEETFTSSPHETTFTVTPPGSGTKTYYVVTQRRNKWGLVSQSTDYTAITIDAAGAVITQTPKAPKSITVTATADRYVRVEATYAPNEDPASVQADTFLIYYTTDGSDPDPSMDTPTEYTMTNRDGLAKLDQTIGQFSESATIKVLVRTRRQGSPDVDSVNTTIYTVAATASGPTGQSRLSSQQAGVGDLQDPGE